MFNFLCDYLNYRIFSEERQYIYVIFSELYKKRGLLQKQQPGD
nr:MAG TPA: Nrap protein domain 1 [Caudoviricetes sp.]